MVREQRREELIAELEATGAQWVHFFPTSPPPLWREPIAAFLRGKPMVAPRSGAMFGKGISCEQLREFLDLFPSTQLVEIDGEDAKTEVLELLASRSRIRFRSTRTRLDELLRSSATAPSRFPIRSSPTPT
jgi:hypothetical protein